MKNMRKFDDRRFVDHGPARRSMMGQLNSSLQRRSDETRTVALKPENECEISQIRQDPIDIVEAARSLGFSPKELLEIKRVYQRIPKGYHK